MINVFQILKKFIFICFTVELLTFFTYNTVYSVLLII